MILLILCPERIQPCGHGTSAIRDRRGCRMNCHAYEDKKHTGSRPGPCVPDIFFCGHSPTDTDTVLRRNRVRGRCPGECRIRDICNNL